MQKRPPLSSSKNETFMEWMKGDHLLVHIDARREEVLVPEHLKGHPALTLKLSYLFQGRTEQNDEGIVSYLKFSGSYFECRLPWNCIWGMTSEHGEQVVWPEDVPKELSKSAFVLEAEQRGQHSETKSRSKPNLTPVHSLRPREKRRNDQGDSAPDDPPTSPDDRRKGLTRIK